MTRPLAIFVASLGMMSPTPSDFKSTQMTFARVKTAYDEKEKKLQQLLTHHKLDYNRFNLFIRAFKQEQVLEVWVANDDSSAFKLIITYPFCATSGKLGPKRREGDLQIPEGIYFINHFNPKSQFHLSLGVNYPNADDRKYADKDAPGSHIYIHGNCVTVGCIPITDDSMKELYVMAVQARQSGQEKIPVHLYPTRLNQQMLTTLIKKEQPDKNVIALWQKLQSAYLQFEESKTLN